MIPSTLLAIVLSFPNPSIPIGYLSETTLKSQMPQVLWSHLDDRMEILEEEGESRVRVHYPQGRWGSRESGAQILFQLPDSDTSTCEYRVRFGPGFDFVKGGKLPGLAGGKVNSGGERAQGDGWSARYMWRQNGRAVLYLYHLDQKSEFGDQIPLRRSFRPGVWHHLKQEIRVNSSGHANGRIRIWFDGELVLDLDALRLQRGENAPINRFYFSTFFGGNGREWAPSREQIIDFSAIRIDAENR